MALKLKRSLQRPKKNIKYRTSKNMFLTAFPPHLFQEQLNSLRHCIKINLCEVTRIDAILVPPPFLQEQLNPLLHHLVDGKPSGTTIMNPLIQRMVDDKLTSVKAPQQTQYLSRSSSFKKS